eukprot:1518878-Pyramimonas_sp.AAC.2
MLRPTWGSANWDYSIQHGNRQRVFLNGTGYSHGDFERNGSQTEMTFRGRRRLFHLLNPRRLVPMLSRACPNRTKPKLYGSHRELMM